MSGLDQNRVARIRETGYLHDSFIDDNLSVPAWLDRYAEFSTAHSYRSRWTIDAVGVGSAAKMIYTNTHTPNGNLQTARVENPRYDSPASLPANLAAR